MDASSSPITEFESLSSKGLRHLTWWRNQAQPNSLNRFTRVALTEMACPLIITAALAETVMMHVLWAGARMLGGSERHLGPIRTTAKSAGFALVWAVSHLFFNVMYANKELPQTEWKTRVWLQNQLKMGKSSLFVNASDWENLNTIDRKQKRYGRSMAQQSLREIISKSAPKAKTEVQQNLQQSVSYLQLHLAYKYTIGSEKDELVPSGFQQSTREGIYRLRCDTEFQSLAHRVMDDTAAKQELESILNQTPTELERMNFSNTNPPEIGEILQRLLQATRGEQQGSWAVSSVLSELKPQAVIAG